MKSKLILVILSISFVALGILELIGLVKLSSVAYFSYSLAAFLFVINDILDKINNRVYNIKMLELYQFILKLLAMMSILILPYTKGIYFFDRIRFALIPLVLGMLFTVMSGEDIFNSLLLIFEKSNEKDKENTFDKNFDIDRKIQKKDVAIANTNCNHLEKEQNDIISNILTKSTRNSIKKRKRYTLYDKIKKTKED
ncbi:MAG: hypothetical protein ABF289_01130 [Clostridiales bacterium]